MNWWHCNTLHLPTPTHTHIMKDRYMAHWIIQKCVFFSWTLSGTTGNLKITISHFLQTPRWLRQYPRGRKRKHPNVLYRSHGGSLWTIQHRRTRACGKLLALQRTRQMCPNYDPSLVIHGRHQELIFCAFHAHCGLSLLIGRAMWEIISYPSALLAFLRGRRWSPVDFPQKGSSNVVYHLGIHPERALRRPWPDPVLPEIHLQLKFR